MSDMFALEGPRFGPAAGGKPQSLVLLLHGLGADGNDLISLAPYWAKALPNTAFVSPHAPFPCDMAPYGRQWFSLQDRSPGMILAGVRAAAPILDAFIDAELTRHGLAADKLALAGFSQGTMMSLYVAPRREKAIAGVVGYSGARVGADLLVAEAMAAAATGLRAAGIAVETLARPGLPHSIDDEGLMRGGSFLAQRLR
jgi:phospholipase/carboxylesterase